MVRVVERRHQTESYTDKDGGIISVYTPLFRRNSRTNFKFKGGRCNTLVLPNTKHYSIDGKLFT